MNTSLGEQGVLTQWHAIAINDSAFTPPHWEGIVIEDTPGGVVGIAGYYAENDQYQHVIVGTTDGKVHEIYWKIGQQGIEGQYILTQFNANSIVGIAGYYAENDTGQHVIVGTKDGNVYDFSLISHL